MGELAAHHLIERGSRPFQISQSLLIREFVATWLRTLATHAAGMTAAGELLVGMPLSTNQAVVTRLCSFPLFAGHLCVCLSGFSLLGLSLVGPVLDSEVRHLPKILQVPADKDGAIGECQASDQQL
jgi:hypothetical protein